MKYIDVMYLYFIYCLLIEYMKYIDVIYLHLVRCILIVVINREGEKGVTRKQRSKSTDHLNQSQVFSSFMFHLIQFPFFGEKIWLRFGRS